MKKYRVTLTAEEREQLEQMLSRGKADVRKLKHGHILLKADQAEGGPAWSDEQIADALEVGVATVNGSVSASSRRDLRRPFARTASARGSTTASSTATRKPT